MGQPIVALLEIAVVSTVAINVGTADAAVAAMLLLALHRRSVLRQALRPVSWRGRLRIIALITAAIWLMILLSGPVMDLVGLPRPDLSSFTHRVRGNSAVLFLMLIWVWTAVAFGEEMLGRVFLIDRFEVLFGSVPGAAALAVVAAAVLFGLAHAYQGPGGVLLTGAIGLVMGLIYVQQQKRIWVNVAVHGTVDTAAMLLLYWGVRFI